VVANARRWLLAATGGGILCVVGDHLHVSQGVLFYPRAAFWDQAWWVFPLFFGATLVVVGGVRLIHPSPRTPGSTENPEHPARVALGDLVAFFTAYAFTAYAHSLPDVVLWVLVGLWLARVIHGMAPRHVLFCLLVALGGTLWEAMFSGLGAFTYRHPDFLGVPRWLPALYLHAAVLADSARTLLGEPPRILPKSP
jgi:hypothetical protein